MIKTAIAPGSEVKYGHLTCVDVYKRQTVNSILDFFLLSFKSNHDGIVVFVIFYHFH